MKLTLNPNKICTRCGEIGKPKRMAKGSFLMEVFLWLFFIVPGMFYSLWRMCNKYDVCAQCGWYSLVLESSKRGQEIISKYK